MSHRIKITAALPGPGDATSLYRATGPFAMLRRNMDLDVDYPTGFMWTVVRSSDLVFLQRPCHQDHYTIAKMTKNCNLPLWIDIDDDLLDVPMENPVWVHYRDPQVKQIILSCLALADHISVATPSLANKIKSLGINAPITIIPNAFDETWLKGHDPLSKAKNQKTICWRGTDSHIKDLASVAEDILQVAELHPDIKWIFIGHFPWYIAERMINKFHVDHIKPMDPFEYFQYLKNTADHAIGIVPLVNNSLNVCKSNIAWQEHTLAGAATLAPDLPEWQHPGILTYGPEKSFKDQLCYLIENPQIQREMIQCSLKTLKDDLSLSKINKLRQKVIYSLLDQNVELGPNMSEQTTSLVEPVMDV